MQRMLKKWFLWIVLMALGSWVTPVHAGKAGIFASHWDSKDMGSEIGFGALIRLNSGAGLQMDLRGSRFEFEKQHAGAGTTELELTPLELVFISPLAPAPDFRPYIGAGAGYYIAEGSYREGARETELDVSNEWGYFLLGGLDIRLARSFNFFAEAKYTRLKIDDLETEDVPQRLSRVTMTGLAFNLGLMLSW